MDRDSLLTNTQPRKYKGDLAFIRGFHRQYKEVDNIFKKHWPILLKDKYLGSLLRTKPKFIYRRAPGLRNKIAPNIPDPPKQSLGLFWTKKGSFTFNKFLRSIRFYYFSYSLNKRKGNTNWT